MKMLFMIHFTVFNQFISSFYQILKNIFVSEENYFNIVFYRDKIFETGIKLLDVIFKRDNGHKIIKYIHYGTKTIYFSFFLEFKIP